MIDSIGKSVCTIVTEDLRTYLAEYQKEKQSSKVTIDNIRRIFSSFFAWLEDEDYIIKSPVRRIHRIKAASTIKETYTDEQLESMRDNCDNPRDLALIDILASTGMRVGELVLLNRDDISFDERECIVFGKHKLTYYISIRHNTIPALYYLCKITTTYLTQFYFIIRKKARIRLK